METVSLFDTRVLIRAVVAPALGLLTTLVRRWNRPVVFSSYAE